jgi:hypothetical protein
MSSKLQPQLDPLVYYRRHTPVTDPGDYLPAVQRLPRDVGSLIEIIGGLFLHYQRDVQEKGVPIEPHRRPEIDARFVSRILGHVLGLEGSPLDQPRPFERRYLGTCRDAAVLLCSMLRSHDTPARLRFGFASLMYQSHRPLTDHVLVEYWSHADQQWRYADSRMYESVRAKHGIPLSPVDIPSEAFVPAAQAWLRGQEKQRTAFDLSGYAFDANHGLWKARNLLMYDLASLYGCEPLLWDAWGYMMHARPYLRPKGWFQYRELNQLARLDTRDPVEWRRLMELYDRRAHVRVPETIRAFSGINGDQVVHLPLASRAA